MYARRFNIEINRLKYFPFRNPIADERSSGFPFKFRGSPDRKHVRGSKCHKGNKLNNGMSPSVVFTYLRTIHLCKHWLHLTRRYSYLLRIGSSLLNTFNDPIRAGNLHWNTCPCTFASVAAPVEIRIEPVFSYVSPLRGSKVVCVKLVELS